MTRKIFLSFINLLFLPFLGALGFRKEKTSTSKILQSHFYEGDNNLISLVSICKGFLSESGWIKSRNTNESRTGSEIVPWLTYGSIYFLNQLELSNKKILEFGSGASTFWFSEKCRQVTSFESDTNYLSGIKSELGVNKNVNLLTYPISNKLKKSEIDYKEAMIIEKNLGNHEKFISTLDLNELQVIVAKQLSDTDILLIDGGPRFLVAQICLKTIKTGTLIIVDNTDRKYEENISKMLTNIGYLELPFYGLGPLNPYAWKTSIFVHNSSVEYWLREQVIA